jgi:CrcB protein
VKGIEFILLAVGAILGAYIRYKITSFPLILGIFGSNVLLVNIIGSFILGVFSILLVSWNLDQRYAFLVAIGFCGSLTTMSSFALENMVMIENKQILNMMINTMANVGFSFLALYGGRILIIQLLQ